MLAGENKEDEGAEDVGENVHRRSNEKEKETNTQSFWDNKTHVKVKEKGKGAGK
jgi:hypothetical protein